MTLKQRLESIKELESTSIEVMNTINTYGKITGSVAWGVNTSESDIDVIISPNSDLKFCEIVSKYNGIYLHGNHKDGIVHYVQENLCSCYVFYDNKIYNLLFMNNLHTYHKWCYATEKMSQKILNQPSFQNKIRDKKLRIKYFEHYKKNFELKEDK